MKFSEYLEEARMSAAAKLQKAFEREQERTARERKAGEDLLNKNKEKPVKEGYSNYDNNRTGFAKRRREDDEYHTPDPVGRTHKIVHTVSKEGGEKHSRTVTISNSTKSHEEAKAAARAHLEKQGYKIHEEAEHVTEAAIPKGHTIEAHGIKGMKGTPWRKTFKSHDHLNDWAEKNDSVEVHGTRELEGVKKHVKEERVSKHKDLGATNATTHFVKNVTTGEVLSPHRGRHDAEEGLRAAEADGAKGHKFKIVRAVKEDTIAEGVDHHAAAEESKLQAGLAQRANKPFDHHMHMADHHDHMAQWHDSKGRHGEAARHAEKSDEHHEKAMNIKEEVEQIDELSKTTLASYAKKATKDLSTNAYLAGVTKSHHGGSDDEAVQRRKNRRTGLPKAIDRLAKEETETCRVCNKNPCWCDDSHGFVEGLKPEHNMRPGWMLKADPELAKKVKENQKRFKTFKDTVGKPIKKD